MPRQRLIYKCCCIWTFIGRNSSILLWWGTILCWRTDSILYQIISKVNPLRKKVSIWNLQIFQRYADNNFYAFTKGNVLACFTNVNSLERPITYHEYNEGDTLCNILYDNDCVSVSGGTIDINMGDYPKVYVEFY